MHRCLPVLLLAGISALAQPSLVTSDIDNFWRAYDASEPGKRTEAFQRRYLDQASPGLKDFLRLRIESAASLADAVDRKAKFYASIRQNTLQVERERGAILKYLDRFRDVFPEAKIPTVYFVIGKCTSGGTFGPSGLLIGAEVFSLGPGVELSEIGESFRKAMGTAEKLPLIVVHELVHVQQKQALKSNLLVQTMREGSADFVTDLVTGSNINAYARDWAEARKDELFRSFRRDLAEHPDAIRSWMYNYATARDEPADLGYWIGAEVCRDYYSRSANKQAALKAIMRMSDPKAIVKGSSYAWLLKR